MVGGGRNNLNRMQNDRAKGGINRKKSGEKIDRGNMMKEECGASKDGV